jgi:hypothetical protein
MLTQDITPQAYVLAPSEASVPKPSHTRGDCTVSTCALSSCVVNSIMLLIQSWVIGYYTILDTVCSTQCMLASIEHSKRLPEQLGPVSRSKLQLYLTSI